MNNLLRTLTESSTQFTTQEPEFKLLLTAVKEARRQSNDTKQSDAFYDSLESLLNDLRTVTMDNHDAEAFLKPVVKAEVPDYYDFISHPMDLQTMLKKVKQKQYKSKREFKDDLDLIWSNCFAYNSTENHPLRQCATRLKAKAEKLLKNITDRRERIDPPIPTELSSRGSTPKTNGINGHIVGRARPVAYTKSPSPVKQFAPSVNGKPPRRDGSPSGEPVFQRTPEGMAAFLRLDRELDARLDEQFKTNGISGPTLEEQLMEYVPLYADDERGDHSPSTIDGGLGEKRKLNGYSDYRPRKRTRMADKDVVELWWDAMQSEAMLANGVPILRHSQSDDLADSALSRAITDPPRMPTTRARKKRRKTSNQQPQNNLVYYMNNNINTLRRVRTTHARLTALKETTAAEENMAPGGLIPQASLVLPPVDEPDSVVDDDPWRLAASGVEIGAKIADDCLHWMGGKVLEHAGFQGASKAALDVLAGVTSDYLHNVGRTIRFLCDKYSKQMTPEEIVLHTLFESGITRIHELERYIKDDVVRYGSRLTELEKKLTAAYEEATTGEAWDDEALFRIEDEEEDSEFVMGNFAGSFGEDFFGLRELGIADELGLSSLTVPRKLLKGKKQFNPGAASIEPKEPPPPFPPPPPFVSLDSSRIDDQIGLLKSFYQQRVQALAPPPPPSTIPTPGLSGPSMPSIPPLPGAPNPPQPSTSPGLHPPPAPGMLPSHIPPSSFGPPTLTSPPPLPPQQQHYPLATAPAQPIIIPDEVPSLAHTKLGPIGQVLKSAPAATTASAKKKSASKPKTPATGGVGSVAPEGGDVAPDTPMTAGTAATPTATVLDSPKKNKGASAGAGGGGGGGSAVKKKKAGGEANGIPTIIMSTASF